MAVQQCTSCGERFRHDLRGRPPKMCPTCRSGGRKGGQRFMDTQDRPFIVNKRPGICQQYVAGSGYCGAEVEAGRGFAIRIGGTHGQWEVRCQAHKPIAREEKDRNLPPPTENLPNDDGGETQVPTIDAEELIQKVLDRIPPMDQDMLRKLTVEEIETRLPELLANMGKQEINLTINDVRIELPKSHHANLPTLIKYLSRRRHVFMPGPAGAGKSTLFFQACQALGLQFGSMSFGPDTPTHRLFGFIDANGNYHTTEFRKVYECVCDDDTYDPNTCECGGLFLGDEMDNAEAGLLTELNQALANDWCAFGDKMVRRGRRFCMVATGNTFGRGSANNLYQRAVLDGATLDRFWTLETLYDEVLERTLAMAYSKPGNGVVEWINLVQSVRAKAVELKLLIIVSPRACIEGAEAIAQGDTVEEVINNRLLPGMEAEIRRQLGIMVGA